VTTMSTDRTMLMHVDLIDASGRYREDMGDVRLLAESIKRVGLLHPVVVTRDGKLIAGGRRLAAFTELGRKQIPVTIVDSLGRADAPAETRARRVPSSLNRVSPVLPLSRLPVSWR
jgi:hypothetical protein